MKNLNQIAEFLQSKDDFILCGHVSPDGDCIGSTFALALALKKLGKEAKIYLESFLPVYQYLAHTEMVITTPEEMKESVTPIFLDASDEGRLGEGAKYLALDGSVNVDHHGSNNNYGQMNYVEADASSTCEIVYKLIKELGVSLDKDIAKALYTGIIYDTGTFRHPNTSSFTMAVASDLLSYDIEASDLINTLFFTKSLPSMKLLGQALEQVEMHLEGKIAVTSIRLSDIEAKEGTLHDVDGIVQYVAQIEGIEGAVFLYEKQPGEVKVSLRSKKTWDVAHFASKFGGGGHVRAAGCTLRDVTVEEATHQVLDMIMKCRSEVG